MTKEELIKKHQEKIMQMGELQVQKLEIQTMERMVVEEINQIMVEMDKLEKND